MLNPKINKSEETNNLPSRLVTEGVLDRTPQVSNSFKICTLNVRTLIGEDRLWEIENALHSMKWDVVGLCEVRRNNNSIEERKSGNIPRKR